MKTLKLIVFVLLLLPCIAMARDLLEPTKSGNELYFSTLGVPERAAVVVTCSFENYCEKEYLDDGYVFVTPLSDSFAKIEKSYLGSDNRFLYTIGSKVYLNIAAGCWQEIRILGVTKANEAIVMDLTHTSPQVKISCSY